VELTIYPFASPHLYGRVLTAEQKIPKDLELYVQPTLAMNYSPQMKQEVQGIVREARTDIEAVTMILKWIAAKHAPGQSGTGIPVFPRSGQ